LDNLTPDKTVSASNEKHSGSLLSIRSWILFSNQNPGFLIGYNIEKQFSLSR
jgi:hypothetical protein